MIPKPLPVKITCFQQQDLYPLFQQLKCYQNKKYNFQKIYKKIIKYKINKKVIFKKIIVLLRKRYQIYHLSERFFGFFFCLMKNDLYFLHHIHNIRYQIKQTDQQFDKKELMFYKYKQMERLHYILMFQYKYEAIEFSQRIQHNYLKKQRHYLLECQCLPFDLREVLVQYYNFFFFICIILSFINFNNSEVLLQILCFFIPSVQQYIVFLDMEDSYNLQHHMLFYS